MDYKSRASTSTPATKSSGASRAWRAATYTPGVLSELGSFGGLFHLGARGQRDPGARRERRRRRHQAARRVHERASTARSAPISSITASTTSSCRARSRCSSSTTSRPAASIPTSPCRSSRGWRARAARTAARCSAARRRRCRGSTPTASTTSPASSSAAVERDRLIDGRRIAPGDVLIGLPSSGLHTNGYSLARAIVFERLRLGVARPRAGAWRDGRRGAARAAPFLPARRSGRCSRTAAWIKGMAHITGGGITDNLPRVLPAGHRGGRAARIVGGAAAVPVAAAGGRGAAGRHAAHVQHGRRPDPGGRAGRRRPA